MLMEEICNFFEVVVIEKIYESEFHDCIKFVEIQPSLRLTYESSCDARAF